MDKILCDELSDGLKKLADRTILNEDQFKSLLGQVHTLLKNPSNFGPLSDDHDSSVLALMTLMTEACRHHTEVSQLEAILRDHNFDDGRVELMQKLYEALRMPLATQLDAINSHLPHIIGADWSLDFCLKDSSSERVSELEFLVDLHTQGVGGAKDKVQFACNVEEMHDFVEQLRDAARHVEKIANQS